MCVHIHTNTAQSRYRSIERHRLNVSSCLLQNRCDCFSIFFINLYRPLRFHSANFTKLSLLIFHLVSFWFADYYAIEHQSIWILDGSHRFVLHSVHFLSHSIQWYVHVLFIGIIVNWGCNKSIACIFCVVGAVIHSVSFTMTSIYHHQHLWSWEWKIRSEISNLFSSLHTKKERFIEREN